MKRISKRSQPRRGFTLVEVILAGVITAFVLGAVSMCLSQLGRAKSTSKTRFDAFHRADVAICAIRSNIATMIRTDDLFFTRFVLIDDSISARLDGESREWDRDEMMLFTNQLREIHASDYSGEGIEYESHYRIEEDDYGPMLWHRRDAVPDEYELGGGTVRPLVDGIVALKLEAYDGIEWNDTWDSDVDGLPLAVRVTVAASGYREDEDPYNASLAILRTVVPVDRLLPPKDLFDPAFDPETEAMEDSPEDVDFEGGAPGERIIVDEEGNIVSGGPGQVGVRGGPGVTVGGTDPRGGRGGPRGGGRPTGGGHSQDLRNNGSGGTDRPQGPPE